MEAICHDSQLVVQPLQLLCRLKMTSPVQDGGTPIQNNGLQEVEMSVPIYVDALNPTNVGLSARNTRTLVTHDKGKTRFLCVSLVGGTNHPLYSTLTDKQ